MIVIIHMEEAYVGLTKLSSRSSHRDESLTDKIREAGDVAGTATGAIYNIIKSKATRPRDVIRKGAVGALLGFQAGDGFGDFAGWMAEKKEKEKAKK